MDRCLECNSSNVTCFNTRKRGLFSLTITILILLASIVFRFTGSVYFGLLLMFIYSARAIYQNKTVVTCKDCWCSLSKKNGEM